MGHFNAILETLISLSSGYAASVKEISLGTAYSTNPLGEPDTGRNGAELNKAGGQFLNVLLVATVKKATSVGSFRWDIRVEVSPSFYRTLSEAANLRVLHVRLPAPPRSAKPSSSTPVHNQQAHHVHYHANQLMAGAPFHSMPAVPNSAAPREVDASKTVNTFSLFSGMHELSVVDIHDLGYVQEIAHCISASSSNLRSLKLSFSEERGLKARKVPMRVPIDDWDGWNGVPNHITDAWGFPSPGQEHPATTHLEPKVRRERLIQEGVLASVLGLERSIMQQRQDKAMDKYYSDENKATRLSANGGQDQTQDRKFVKTFRFLLAALPHMLVPNPDTPLVVRLLAKMQKSATLYLQKNGEIANQPADVMSLEDVNSAQATTNAGPSTDLQSSSSLGLGNSNCPSNNIDVEYPGVATEIEDEESVEGEASEPNSPGSQCSSDETTGSQSGDSSYQSEDTDEEERIMEYIRGAHGLSLEKLSLYLIPVSATVLSRGVDLTTLRHLSLLNVGNQGPIWLMLKRSLRTCRLTSIHTDNVTPSFLGFVRSLDKVTELFMYERALDDSVPSIASKSAVSITDIRTFILNKHIEHLVRLVIRNDESNIWVLDSQIAHLITTGGSKLVELCVGVDTISMHALLSGLGNMYDLAALQVIWSRSEICASVLSEMHVSVVNQAINVPWSSINYIGMCYARGTRTNRIIEIDMDSTFGEDDVCYSTLRRACDIVGIKMWESAMWNFRL